MQQKLESSQSPPLGPPLRSHQKRARSILRVPSPGQDQVHGEIVKRFHHAGRLGRLWDGQRAQREASILTHLSRAGVRVPKLLGLERTGASWNVSMELIPGACTLREKLTGPLSAVSATRIARDLGHQLALLHAAGIEQRDLHAGNVMVDDQDRIWLIDFSAARRARVGVKRMERDLLQGEAFLRERLPARLRLRALVAYRRTLPKRLTPRNARLRALASSLAARAPGLRRTIVARGQGRWLRESGVLRRLATPEGHVLVNSSLGIACPADATQNAPDRFFVRGQPQHLRARWLAAAAAFEHALPVAIPWCLRLEGDETWALFHLPPASGVPTEELEFLLEDRGLEAQPLKTLRAAGGGFLLEPPLRLTPLN